MTDVKAEQCKALGIMDSSDPLRYAVSMLIQTADAAQMALLNSAGDDRIRYLRELANGRVQEYITFREKVKEMLKI